MAPTALCFNSFEAHLVKLTFKKYQSGSALPSIIYVNSDTFIILSSWPYLPLPFPPVCHTLDANCVRNRNRMIIHLFFHGPNFISISPRLAVTSIAASLVDCIVSNVNHHRATTKYLL